MIPKKEAIASVPGKVLQKVVHAQNHAQYALLVLPQTKFQGSGIKDENGNGTTIKSSDPLAKLLSLAPTAL